MRKKVVLVGASTGGPAQIKEILSSMESLSCTVIISQHMKEEVLPFFIKDLQESLKVQVQSTPCRIFFNKPSIIVCSQSSVVQKKFDYFKIVGQEEGQHYTPDINKLFHSFSSYTKDLDIQALIMTGIGRDGIDGAMILKKNGAKIIAQDEKTSPVYGMPKAAYESGIVDEVKSLDEITAYFSSL